MFRLPIFRLPIFRLNCALLTAVFLAAGSHATAGIITQPLGLDEGDQYRLVFVTSSGRNAVPDGVAPYNDFVTNAANLAPELAALNTDWRAIVSSSTVGARANTGTSSNEAVSIYRLDGLRIAVTYGDLWNGGIIRPINLTELGTIRSSNIWSGSNSDGTPRSLGVDGVLVAIGNSSSTDAGWISNFSTSVRDIAVFPVYGMSGILTATAQDAAVPEPSPAAVPEPSTFALLGLAGVLLGFRRLARRSGASLLRKNGPTA